mmetsp:Transcript_30324/g.61170  ORF Transcript_30324/g.61170 Transcript_30324/m.61170 type:complete len:292 (-) Transcript_30324:193-1068(-)|eukprot:CAMPEP_0171332450 /NCGR_PEP_ID=MMETSP0878-20121228/3364_1 /TAXON_ID=67004 /ORGANISM="Thalassiosira weissflogii, Strain CCMP1336" /LENGTH=291 /DNA_ID=CAMNT_0011833187 /DNA_START=38 /DNA_END=913 /DNA_ORIENTATION=-
MMIRSTLLARRVATSLAPKGFAPTSSISPISAAVESLSKSTCAITPPTPFFITLPTTQIPKSSFSTSSRELHSILLREIEEEEEASSSYSGSLPTELSELHADISKNWTILEGISGIGGDSGPSGSGATVRMFRKQGGSNGGKIGVVFHCQDTEEDDFGYDEEYEDGGEEEEEEPPQSVRFGVTVSKAGKTVVMQCRAGQGEVSVESVAVRDGDTEAVLAALAGGEGVHSSLYQGPEFTELAEDLQEAFNTYVEKECGIDSDVLAFITMYADYREQEEYVAWMKSAVSILS